MNSIRLEAICLSIILVIVVFLCLLDFVEAQDACYQKADQGYCRASIPRFYFDARTGRCDTFLYGGCGGNRNNFPNVEACNSFRNYCLKRRG